MVVLYFGEGSAEPIEGVDVVALAGAEERVKHRCSACAFVAACKEIVLAANGDGRMAFSARLLSISN